MILPWSILLTLLIKIHHKHDATNYNEKAIDPFTSFSFYRHFHLTCDFTFTINKVSAECRRTTRTSVGVVNLSQNILPDQHRNCIANSNDHRVPVT